MFMSLNLRAIGLSPSYEEAIELARTAGFDAIDLPVSELAQRAETTSLQALREHLRVTGVRPGGWELPVNVTGSEDAYQVGLKELPRYAQVAQEFGSPWCTTWIPSYSNTFTYDAFMELHIRRLRPVAQILADHQCRLGLEFLGTQTLRTGYTYEFIHTISEAVALGTNIGTGNLGLLLDSWHWYTSHATLDDIEHLTADQIVSVHVNDAPAQRTLDEQIDTQRLLPGASGVIDIAGFLHALAQIGYDGPVVAEPFQADLGKLPAPERVRAVKASLEKVWVLAKLKG